MATAHRQLNCRKTKVCVVNLLVAIFVDQRIKGLEKKAKETQISKSVFSQQKPPTMQCNLLHEMVAGITTLRHSPRCLFAGNVSLS